MSAARLLEIARRVPTVRLAMALALLPAAPGGSAHAQEPDPAGAADTVDVAPDTSDVLAAAESFLGAFNRLEWEPFHAAFSPDATVFQPFGEPFRNEGRGEVAAFFRSFFDRVRAARDGPPYLDIVPEDLRIDPLGEAAVVTFHLSGETEVGRRTLVFGRDEGDGSWRVAHLHASSLERPGKADGEASPSSRALDAEAARRYAGGYVLSLPDSGRMEVTFRVGDEGLEAELGGSARELRYLGGHTFRDVDAGYLFVFNVERDGRAVGITGLPPGLDRVEVFDRVEESR